MRVRPPRPPADLAKRTPRLVELAPRTIVHRFYSAAFEPLYFDKSPAGRLNAPDGAYGVLYAAKRTRGAFAETFLRTPGRRMIDPGLLGRWDDVSRRFMVWSQGLGGVRSRRHHRRDPRWYCSRLEQRC